MSISNRWRCLPLVFLWVSGCSVPGRPPEIFELPWDFTGWARIEYENQECPPLNWRDGKRVVKISANGLACTSSEYLLGIAKDEYYRVKGGKVEMLDPFKEVWGGGTIGPTTLVFFVGSEEKYDNTAPPWEGTLGNSRDDEAEVIEYEQAGEVYAYEAPADDFIKGVIDINRTFRIGTVE